MENSGRDWLVLIALCFVGVLVGRSQTAARGSGERDLVTGTVQQAVNGGAGAVTRSLDWVGDYVASLSSGRELIERNRRLEQQLRAINLYTASVERLQREIDLLRRTIELPPLSGREKVYGQVIGYFPREHRLTISSGSGSGVRSGDPVVTGDGLVGIVSTVGRDDAQVALLTSPQVQIGAIIDRNPPPAGLLRGVSATQYVLELAEVNSPFELNDLVLTSGYGRLPRGIVIGRIIRIENDEAYGKRLAYILPSVQVGSVREVVVYK